MRREVIRNELAGDAISSVVRNEDQICCYRSITSKGRRALWEIVRACNLKCDFCLVPDGGKGRPLNDTARTAYELVEANVEKVMLSGGEPLLYKHIEAILDILVEAGVLVKILTNGTVHRETVLNRIADTPAIELSVSLGSIREDLSDAIFGVRGAHARIMALFDRIAPMRIHVNVVCGRHNCDEIAGVLDFAEARGVGSVSLINVFQNPAVEGRFREDCRIHALSAEESEKLLAFVEDRRKSSSGLVVRTLNFVSRGCETCEAGRSIVYVDAEGRILPCTLTENSAFARLTAGLTISEALAVFRNAVPDLPASSCEPALRASAALSRREAGDGAPGRRS